MIKCDDLAVVDVLNTGRARDTALVSCARNAFLLTFMFNISLMFLIFKALRIMWIIYFPDGMTLQIMSTNLLIMFKTLSE